MVLTESFRVSLGSSAPNFFLKGIDDKMYSLSHFADAKILLVVFMCNHCPYVQACLDRFIGLQKDYASRGVQVVGMNANDSKDYPEDSFDAMKDFARAKGVNFVYLHDETQDVARAYSAVCTPDIFVYDSERKLCYHGRIDDNWKDSSRVTRQDLRNALDALLEGREVSSEQFPSMGCSIKWK